jgi:hypothetical protein
MVSRRGIRPDSRERTGSSLGLRFTDSHYSTEANVLQVVLYVRPVWSDLSIKSVHENVEYVMRGVLRDSTGYIEQTDTM